MLRVAFALVLLLAPTASAWSVTLDAPRQAGRGHAFLVEACGEGDGRGQLLLAAENASLSVRESRYLDAFDARECRDIIVTPTTSATEVRVEARVRPQEGKVAAKLAATVELLDLPFVASETAEVRAPDGAVLLRVPRAGAWTLVPALPGAALPPPAALRVVELRAPPLEGALVANDGPGDAPLAAWGLGNASTTLRPGESAFVAMDLPKSVLGIAVPKLKAGEAWTASGIVRYGRTNVSPVAQFVEGALLAYTTPDSGPEPLVAHLDTANESLLVEAHTLTSVEVAAALARAADRGARVRVLLEGAPPGGIPAQERALVAALAARGVEVYLMGGEGARYRTMHAKVAVADGRALWIATENLNDGTAKGFGLVVQNETLARAVAAFVEADLSGHDIALAAFSEPPAELAPRIMRRAPNVHQEAGARNVTLVVSPEGAGALATAVASARASLDVMMLKADGDGAMVRALLDAARAGARVRLVLDARHDDGGNAALVQRLSALAQREGLLIEAKLADPARTVHAKAFIVDGRVAYIGSMNWVRPAMEDNREAGLLVESGELAAWMQGVMEKEWAQPREEREVPAAPWIPLLVVACAALSRRPCRASRSGPARGGG